MDCSRCIRRGISGVNSFAAALGALRGAAPISLLAVAACAMLAASAPAADVAVQGKSLVNNNTGAPIRGFHAVWQGVPNNPVAIAADLDAMKNQFGLKGFTFEIGWDSAEPSRGAFQWSPTWDTVFDLAHEKGLYVNVLLTPHYTPNWVYNQGLDVKPKDPDGNDTTGFFLNFAPSSPAALQWQGDFQRAVVEQYKDKPALLSVHLSNEVSYGGSGGSWTDYSTWANAAWGDWLAARGLPSVSMPKPSEASTRPTDWQNWILFRQDQLNSYLNTSYDNVRPALGPNDQVLISQRQDWNAASHIHATKTGLLYDPNLQNRGDIIGGNIYSTNTHEVAAAMMVAADKPIFTTETNLNELVNGTAVPPGSVNRVMLRQFFQGAENQTIYKFSGGTHFPMRQDANTPHPSFAQFKAMAEKIDLITEPDLTAPRQVGYLWLRNYAAVHADQYQNVQQLMNNVMVDGRRVGLAPVVVYPSFFEPDQPSADMLDQLKLIYATRNYGMDQASLNSDGLRDWVAAGGVLFVELSPSTAPPSWSGVTAATTSRNTLSTLASSPFGAISGISYQESRWRLSGLTEGWATWNTIFGSTQYAAGVKNYGQGKVVLLGSNVLGSLNTVPGMNDYVFGSEQLNQSWRYYRLGHNVLVEPDQQSTGLVNIPIDWLGDHTFRSWLMDSDSGLFTWIDAQSAAGKYLFDVPSNHLLMVTAALRGDFNADEQVNAADIDLLFDRIAQPEQFSLFDVNGDARLDQQDIFFQIEQILGTSFGDADLDGDVDLHDLVALAGSYGMFAGVGWANGDFDGDGDVDLNDLANLAAHYPGGSAQAMADFQNLANVPEPASFALLALVGVALKRRY